MLELGEAQRALEELNFCASDDDLKTIFQHLDTDNSGTLEWQKFKSLAQQAHIRNSVMDYIPLVPFLVLGWCLWLLER